MTYDNFKTIRDVIRYLAFGGRVKIDEFVLHMREDGSVRSQDGGHWEIDGLLASDFSIYVEEEVE